jgi:hypothetical protein
MDSSGKWKLTPVYPEPRANYLVARFRRGKLVTRLPALDPYDDVLRPVDTPEFAEHLSTHAVRFFEIEVPSRLRSTQPAKAPVSGPPRAVGGIQADEETKSEILQLIDGAYDPFKLNVIIVRRRVSPLVFQTYLLCLVGDLTSAANLDELKSVKTALQKFLHGTTARGRTREAGAYKIIAALLKHNLEVKPSAIQALERGGRLPSGTGDAKTIERVRRLRPRVRKSIERFV